MRQVHVNVAGDSVAAWFCTPSGASGGIVFVHGWEGCKEQHADGIRQAVASGFACLAFDMRGHQGTDELHDEVNRPDNLQDLLKMYDWLVDQGMDSSRIGLVGVSYGAYLAAIATELRAVRWLALRSPALYPDRDWHLPKEELEGAVDLRKFRERTHAPDRSEALLACAKFDGDALIVESGCDEVIPHAVIQSYVQAFGQARSVACKTIEGADHGLSEPEHRAAFATLLSEWFSTVVRKPSGAYPGESVIA